MDGGGPMQDRASRGPALGIPFHVRRPHSDLGDGAVTCRVGPERGSHDLCSTRRVCSAADRPLGAGRQPRGAYAAVWVCLPRAYVVPTFPGLQ
jgi:hypothetical protein